MAKALTSPISKKILTFLLVFCSLLLASCSSNVNQPGEQVTIQYKNSWSDETADFESKIDEFSYPVFSSKRFGQIANFLNTEVDNMLREYFDPILQDPGSLGDYPEFNLKAEAIQPFGKYLSFRLEGYEFSGDVAHGMPLNEIYVFDTSSQKQIYLSRFIPDLSNKEISALIYRQLRMQLGLSSDSTFAVPESLSYVGKELKWWPSEEGINFFFPVYSVAAYSEGSQKGLVSWIDVQNEFPDKDSEVFQEIVSYVNSSQFDHYLYIDESGNGTYIMVTRVNNDDSTAESVGFWWASEGTYYFRGKVGQQSIDYTFQLESGNSEPFSLDILSSYPLVFNRNSKTNLRVAGPFKDLKYIDFLLNEIDAPIGTSLFLEAEKNNWLNADDSQGD